MSRSDTHAEVVELLELMLEERISPQQFVRLEQLVRDDRDARRLYVKYVDLHGTLHWNAALAGTTSTSSAIAEVTKYVEPLPLVLPASVDEPVAKLRRSRNAAIAVVASLLLLVIGWFSQRSPNQNEVARDERDSSAQLVESNPPQKSVTHQDAHVTEPVVLSNNLPQPGQTREDGQPTSPGLAKVDSSTGGAVVDDTSKTGSNESLVAFVNHELRRVWDDNEQQPAPTAEDSEWLRRAYLDVVGHIPTTKQVREFVADQRPAKRQLMIDELLDREDYVRNWTTIWSNLLIGRTNPRQVNRPALQRFLRQSFAKNYPWDQLVADIVSAEGSTEENGATNFLVAHLNNQAVPATAITAKLFLCQQVQCTQCHDHPFSDLKQDSFWSFNSFFKDIKVVDRPKASNPKVREVVITHDRHPGAIYYETRNGLLKAAYPQFDGERVDPNESTDLRSELAKLMRLGDSPQIARAFVNRMWQHFMGAAFTPQVDDMGVHTRVSHPAVLDRLTREFVLSGYDVKQLVRWICQTETYQLTSQFGKGEYRDDPALGFEPLFSRMYVKRMSVEQAFDSLLIATDPRQTFGSNWDEVEQRRQQWLQQFVRSFETDENDEADLFDGTIPQALMMMNGELIQQALKPGKGTYLDQVSRLKNSDENKIEAICMAALSRKPTSAEIAAVRNQIRDNIAHRQPGTDRSAAVTASLQDIFWAYLNSNEFILIH